MTSISFHRLLGFSHAGRGIAAGIGNEQLDRPAQHAAFGILDFSPELGAAARREVGAGRSAGAAWSAAIGGYVGQLQATGNARMMERAADLNDLKRQVLLRLSGALPEPMVALPVRAGFAYRKKLGRREYVRVTLTRAPDGTIEAQKYPQDGAGVITSLTQTDGLAELPEQTTEVAVGAMIGFLPYVALIG